MKNFLKFLTFLALSLSLLLPLQAQASGTSILVLTIDGPLTPATQTYLARGIQIAEQRSAEAIILQLDTPGGPSPARLRRFAWRGRVGHGVRRESGRGLRLRSLPSSSRGNAMRDNIARPPAATELALARYVRKTLSFSKSEAFHYMVTKWLIVDHNLRMKQLVSLTL